MFHHVVVVFHRVRFPVSLTTRRTSDDRGSIDTCPLTIATIIQVPSEDWRISTTELLRAQVTFSTLLPTVVRSVGFSSVTFIDNLFCDADVFAHASSLRNAHMAVLRANTS